MKKRLNLTRRFVAQIKHKGKYKSFNALTGTTVSSYKAATIYENEVPEQLLMYLAERGYDYRVKEI